MNSIHRPLIGPRIPVRTIVLLTGLVLVCVVLDDLTGRRAEANEPAVAPAKLDPIVPAKIRAHITFLASPELQGREAAARGELLAALYIASHFRQLGLQPLADPKSPGLAGYHQPFRLNAASLENILVEVAGKKYALADDFAFFPFGGAGTARAEIVFCGFGITAPEFEYDDYASVDVKGKIVLVLRHEPNEKGTDRWFSGKTHTRHALFVTKYQNALKHGAAALLLVNDPLHCGSQAHFGVAGGRSIAGLHKPSDKDADKQSSTTKKKSRPGIPAVFGGGELAKLLYERLALKKLQADIDVGRKPKSRPTGLQGTIRVEKRYEVVPSRNVIAVLPGTDPKLRDEYVVVGAHYDHEGVRNGKVMNGANDNASGTTGLMLIAEALATQAARPRRSVVFMAFGAEEKGLLGSRYYVDNPVVPLAKTVAMLNMDMVGRSTKNTVRVGGGYYSPTLHSISQRALAEAGIDAPQFGGRRVNARSDHYPFYARKIPVLTFHSDDMRDYHTPADDIEKITFDMMTKIVRAVAASAWYAANHPTRPEFLRLGRI